MTRYDRVLVGTDGSETAQAAVRLAARVASALGVQLVVATAWSRDRDAGPLAVQVQSGDTNDAASSQSWAQQTVSDAAAAARTAGHDDVSTLTPVGSPADTLVQYAQDNPATLTVVGTIGLDSAAERLMGNVPHNLTHHARGDLLLVRTDRPDHDWERVALATDGSETANAAVRAGLDLARALAADPVLVTVADDGDRGENTLRRTASALGESGLAMEVHANANAGKGLIDLAKGFDLLVIGNKGMSGPSRLLGSVSNKVTHASPVDILLVNTTR